MSPVRAQAKGTMLLIAAILLTTTLWEPVPPARSDGDPASDVLVADSVFYPYSSTVSASLQRTLNDEAAAASKAHFPVKVALIASPFDLGAIPSLFGKPQAYSSFLGQEISFLGVTTRLLVVMPNGYGVRNLGSGASGVVASLKEPAGARGDDLAQAAIIALPKLAAAAGHPIGPAAAGPTGAVSNSGGSNSGGGSSVLKLVVLAIAAIVIAGAVFVFRRGRAARR
jgi:hypothetical protein